MPRAWFAALFVRQPARVSPWPDSKQSKRRKTLALAVLAMPTRTSAHAALRKVSLNRLEKQVQLRLAAGRRPTDDMLTLGGLEKIKYVFVYPETGDIVLAGPAGAWRSDEEGRVVSQASGRPVVQLDDLVVVLRHMMHSAKGQFGCSINPREDALAKTKEFLDESAKSPLKEGTRSRWLKQLRDRMGKQDVVVEGLDPRTRVAQVLVEADYRMKLVGMGIEPGVLGVRAIWIRCKCRAAKRGRLWTYCGGGSP